MSIIEQNNDPRTPLEAVHLALAERALAKADAYRRKGDHYLAKGKTGRADQAFKISERALLRFQTMAVLLA